MLSGRLSADTRCKPKDIAGTKNGLNFEIDGQRTDDESGRKVEVKSYKCPICNGNHILPRCSHFQKESPEGRLKFVRKRGLCYNCLFQGRIATSCPKKSFCKVNGCQLKHSTYLHPKSNPRFAEKSSGPHVPNNPDNRSNYDSRANNNGCANATNVGNDVNGAGVTATGLPLVSVKVRCSGSSRVITYAFLDSGSNTTFCTDELLKQLRV
ncbi:Hypothetical predicted protein [Paramuricea clavata]|uniref:Uncharacterized protein n=1 Tax=Paramuricea clavata TaxID=317549 RepID=A0A6S7JQ25_PARCT|nr:Hypothetical predicted protein [Paramuricea clavata]